MYLLIKTHKLNSDSDLASTDPSNFKVRPIISSIGGPTDRIGWFITSILTQLLKFIPSHLANTKMFLERFRGTCINSECVIESFDVNALYTNVQNESALQAVHELLVENENSINLYGLSVQQIMTLLQACLNSYVFKWCGNYYAQKRGLAMGQRLAPALAIAYMAKIEAPVLGGPLLYCRYIDDCFIVCPLKKTWTNVSNC